MIILRLPDLFDFFSLLDYYLKQEYGTDAGIE